MCRSLHELAIKPPKRDLAHPVQAEQWRWSLNIDSGNDGGNNDDNGGGDKRRRRYHIELFARSMREAREYHSVGEEKQRHR